MMTSGLTRAVKEGESEILTRLGELVFLDKALESPPSVSKNSPGKSAVRSPTGKRQHEA